MQSLKRLSASQRMGYQFVSAVWMVMLGGVETGSCELRFPSSEM